MLLPVCLNLPYLTLPSCIDPAFLDFIVLHNKPSSFLFPHHLCPKVCVHQLQLALTLTLQSQSHSLLNQ